MKAVCGAVLSTVLLVLVIAGSARADDDAPDRASSSQAPVQGSESALHKSASSVTSQTSLLVAGAVSFAIPIHGMSYGVGGGLRAGVDFHHVYLGATFLMHRGDSVDIGWGSTFFSKEGEQHYRTLPWFLVAEAGYAIQIPIAGLRTELVPFFSLGAAFVHVSTTGVYGKDSITDSHLAIGWGLDYRVSFAEPWSLGIGYRMYPLGAAHFSFGDLSAGTYEHGFSTSIFYHSVLAEAAYRFAL